MNEVSSLIKPSVLWLSQWEIKTNSYTGLVDLLSVSKIQLNKLQSDLIQSINSVKNVYM